MEPSSLTMLGVFTRCRSAGDYSLPASSLYSSRLQAWMRLVPSLSNRKQPLGSRHRVIGMCSARNRRMPDATHPLGVTPCDPLSVANGWAT